jgi:hypothetical protein
MFIFFFANLDALSIEKYGNFLQKKLDPRAFNRNLEDQVAVLCPSSDWFRPFQAAGSLFASISWLAGLVEVL